MRMYSYVPVCTFVYQVYQNVIVFQFDSSASYPVLERYLSDSVVLFKMHSGCMAGSLRVESLYGSVKGDYVIKDVSLGPGHHQ
jgi:hypothetical protein